MAIFQDNKKWVFTSENSKQCIQKLGLLVFKQLVSTCAKTNYPKMVSTFI